MQGNSTITGSGVRVLCAALALSLPSVGWAQADAGANPDAAPLPAVTVAAAAEEALTQTARYSGRLDADSRVDLVARVSGTLLEVAFAPGDVVQQGDLLYRIEPDLYAAALREAEGAMRSAEAQRDLAEIERDRQRELVARDASPQANLDNAEAELGRTEGELIRAEASLQTAQINLSYTEITAPFTGKIGPSEADVGALVGPEKGRLATLIALDPIHAEFQVPTAEMRDFLEAVDAGETSTEAAVFLELANGTYFQTPGDADFIDSEVSRGTDSIRVRAEFANPDGVLLNDELVEVELRSSTAAPSLAVPQEAIQRDVQGDYVLVVDDADTVDVRRVSVGRITQGFAEIEDGLEAGENVITEGANKVRPGQKVDAAPAGDG